MKQPHKHAALIKAWADGAEIECRRLGEKWYLATNPQWNDYYEYRIKPEPKPDVVKFYNIYPSLGFLTSHEATFAAATGRAHKQVRATFDGETGQFKSVEIVK